MFNKKILILGGYGFLGNALYHFYKKKNDVVRFGKYPKKKINFKNLKKIKKKFDIIIYSAGGSSVYKSEKYPRYDYQKSVESIKSLIKFLKLKKFSNLKFIFISSAAVFGNDTKKKILKPISVYGKNKILVEKILKKNAQNNLFKLIIIRFFSLYGPGLKKQLLWDVLCKLKKNIFLFYGSGFEIRSWMYIQDAVKIIHLSIKKIKSKIFVVNAPGKDVLSNKDLILKVYKLCKIKKYPIFSKITRPGDPILQKINFSDLNNLGWKNNIKITEGLKKYINWFKKL